MAGTDGALRGKRIGVVRELMLLVPGHTSRIPIATAAAAEIKTMLRTRLGATLVESRRSALDSRIRTWNR